MVPRWDKTNRRWVARKFVNGKVVQAYSSDASTAGADEATAKLTEKLNRLDAPDAESSKPEPTVRELCTAWRDTALPDKALTTGSKKNYTWSIGEVIASAALGKISILDLTREQVEKFLAGGIAKQGWSRNSCRLIKLSFAQAIDWHIDGQPSHKRTLHYNAARRAQIPKEAEQPIESVSLSIEEVERFEKALPGTPLERFFGALQWTGCRRGELAGLSWDHVDLQAGTAKIWQQLVKGDRGWVLENLKNKDKGRRTIQLLPKAKAYLEAQQIVQNKENMANRNLWRNEHNLVFTTKTGHHLDLRQVGREWDKLKMAAKLPDNSTPHSLRHTLASHLVECATPVSLVAALLGDRVATIEKYYVRGTREVVSIPDPFAKARAGLKKKSA